MNTIFFTPDCSTTRLPYTLLSTKSSCSSLKHISSQPKYSKSHLPALQNPQDSCLETGTYVVPDFLPYSGSSPVQELQHVTDVSSHSHGPDPYAQICIVTAGTDVASQFDLWDGARTGFKCHPKISNNWPGYTIFHQSDGFGYKLTHHAHSGLGVGAGSL